MNKHLTLDDRQEIQIGLKSGENFTTIARRIDSDRTTVSREVAVSGFQRTVLRSKTDAMRSRAD